MQQLPIEMRVGEDPVKFNYYLRNSGNLPAIGVVHNETVVLPDKEMPDDQTDQVFDLLKTSLKTKDHQKITSETEPGEVLWYTGTYAVSQSDYKQVTDGPKFLYMLSLVKYRDSNMLDGKWRYTEVCTYTMKGQGLHLCNQHNRIYVSD